MRWSKSYLPTYKETPADAEIPSHKLMLRAGLIKKLTSGVYSFLPLGYRVLRRIENIVREEMNRAGAQEILMPILHPSELYEESGRMANFGPELFKLHDRKERLFALGPTHEEVVTDLARVEMKSYKQLPQTLYQILAKFRDEIRPRFGVMRAREFMMKDAYSFHDSEESLQETYEAMAEAYHRILERCGLDHLQVQADSGNIGGDINHEFVTLADAGESEIVRCHNCDYAANDERADSRGKPLAATEPVTEAPQKVHTPAHTTIEDVAKFLKVSEDQLAKTLLFKSGERDIAVVLPGGRQLNEAKLAKLLDDPNFRPMHDEEIKSLTGADVGFAGPVGLPKSVYIIADMFLDDYDGMVIGANETDQHLRGVKLGRDFSPNETSSVSMVQVDDVCSQCGEGKLYMQRGVELGHIFKLGTKYSDAMNATYLDADGKEHSYIMGCYGFGVSRAVAAAIEQHYDEKGIVWPKSIAPFDVLLLPINAGDDQTMTVVDRLYEELNNAGLDVLIDDRDMRPGPKFADSELIGFPVRITVGERNLKNGQVEMLYRASGETGLVAVEQAAKDAIKFHRS